MANFVSPGVYIIEKDISDYPPTINSSVVGIVGFAGRGPIAGISGQKATLITSPAQLIDTFGEPSEAVTGQALEGALEILEATNSLRFVRCASGALDASAAATVGACPSFLVCATPGVGVGTMPAIGTADATVSSVRFTLTAYDNLRNTTRDSRVYTIPKDTLTLSSTNGGTTLDALKKVIGGEMDSDRVGAFGDSLSVSSFIVGLAAGRLATVEATMEIYNDATGVLAWESCAGLTPVGITGQALTATNTGTASGVSMDTTGTAYLAQSLWPGGGYNAGTRVDGTTSGVSLEVNINGGPTTFVQVNNLGSAEEQFKVGMASGLGFIENQIGTTYDARTSTYITGNMVTGVWNDITPTSLASFEKPLTSLVGAATLNGDQGGVASVTADPRFIKLVQGTNNLADGTNGIPEGEANISTTVIGAVQTDGGKTGIESLDDDAINISIGLCPGPGVGDNQSIQNALITVAERSSNFLALVSPPYAVGTPGNAIDWSNGFSDTRTAAINSSYAAIYWPWLKVFQVFDGKDRWLAPEIYGARQMAVTDAVSDPWFAPAGFVRGRLTRPTDVEVTLNQGDRDSLYSGGNVINPIVNFPQTGIAIFGQRTAQREPTALDRINIRRMMIYIKKQLLASTQRLVFEPNDRFTWQRVEQLVNPMLDDIARRRGITDFKVVCDESTNTPVRIDRNEMWCKVLIKPTKTAEIVIFELNLTNQSANFGTL